MSEKSHPLNRFILLVHGRVPYHKCVTCAQYFYSASNSLTWSKKFDQPSIFLGETNIEQNIQFQWVFTLLLVGIEPDKLSTHLRCDGFNNWQKLYLFLSS